MAAAAAQAAQAAAAQTAQQVAHGDNNGSGEYHGHGRMRRNRSLDRTNEVEQYNNVMRARAAGLGHAQGHNYSASTTHLNLQLGPLQIPPRGCGGSQLADCKLLSRTKRSLVHNTMRLFL